MLQSQIYEVVEAFKSQMHQRRSSSNHKLWMILVSFFELSQYGASLNSHEFRVMACYYLNLQNNLWIDILH